ncbi:MAG: DUF547 domain-containing protein [Acidimicrobiia bacterium]|nr:DUF547 domain-containing protein [Acidimicrobiia bacterium]
MSTPSGPNPLRVAWSVLRAGRRRRPNPSGTDTVDHAPLQPILDELRRNGVAALAPLRGELAAYRDTLAAVDPDGLSRSEALTYWVNLYNAGALDAAARTAELDKSSLLRLPGAFDRPWVTIAGEGLSLDDIEHGKVRRFQDPRIHSALVCGSASCPTLRYEPYRGNDLDEQLEDQMKAFLAAGAAVADRAASVLHLSRIFLWYGGDFARPQRMPTSLPPRRSALVEALRPWLEPELVDWIDDVQPKVRFQSYDWSLACTIR